MVRFTLYKLHFITGTDDVVGPEGMEKFCEDIGVEPENVSLTVTNLGKSVDLILSLNK